MEIKRDIHLERLIKSKHNGRIKIVTGIRRCGKSYLLMNLFRQHLLDDGDPDKLVYYKKATELFYDFYKGYFDDGTVERLTQDVLAIGASEDHFIPRELYAMELDALPNVKSLTYRLMTAAEDAGAHCNVGNPKLVMDTYLDWLAGLRRRDGI